MLIWGFFPDLLRSCAYLPSRGNGRAVGSTGCLAPVDAVNRACRCGLRTPDGAAAVPSGRPGSTSELHPSRYRSHIPRTSRPLRLSAARPPLLSCPAPVSAASPDLNLPQVCFRAPALRERGQQSRSRCFSGTRLLFR